MTPATATATTITFHHPLPLGSTTSTSPAASISGLSNTRTTTPKEITETTPSPNRKDVTCIKEPHSKDRLLRYYPNVVYREAIWSLAEPIFEHLEHLIFRLSDLRRYYNNIGRLNKLNVLVVRCDLEFKCNCCSCTPEADLRRQRKEETLRLLVQFVKDHIKPFPGRLRAVYVLYTDYWQVSQFCPKNVMHEIFQIVTAV
ncbi:hypothetical protein BGX24_002693 [Mortierella sp. AD032]|nr:hypothetical protein BGX24_002693 [Mortierella sp. AD032]